MSAARASRAVQMTGARLTLACLAVQASGASPFWCVKATRDATEAAQAAKAAKHNADAVLRAAALRSAGATRPLGLARPPPSPG